MKSKVIVPPRISSAIRSFGLSRQVLVDLLIHIHEGALRDYETYRHRRMKDERYCQYRIAVASEGEEHLFVLAVDDTRRPIIFESPILGTEYCNLFLKSR